MKEELTHHNIKKIQKDLDKNKAITPAEKLVKLDISFEEAIKKMVQTKPAKKK